MHEGRVVHFEDDEDWRDIVASRLVGSPQWLVGQATNLAEALEMLHAMKNGEVDANVVILGGNLTPGAHMFDTRGRRDPAIISETIRKLGLRVKTIGLSGLAMEEYGVSVDVDIPKMEFSKADLPALLTGLPEPKAKE